MDFLKVIILGIIEGMTEFLPVSSTGHLILGHEFFPLEPESFQNAFDVMIQLGAILAVVVLYFHKLNPFSRREEFYRQTGKDKVPYTINLWLKVLVGILPSAVLGLLFDDFIDAHLFSTKVVATMLIVWGIIIILVESRNNNRGLRVRAKEVDNITFSMALGIGFFQCFAMIPGTSRSAATIMGGMLIGASRVAAAEFSFFLAIPTMLGATLLKVVKIGLDFTTHQWILVILGGVFSFVVAIIVIKKFLDFIKKHDFKPFGVYRIILGLIIFALLYLQ